MNIKFKLGFSLLVILIAVTWTLPNEYKIKKEIVIFSSLENIHFYVSDLVQWSNWDPIDTGETKYGKITKGKGAFKSWKAGDLSGRIILTESSQDLGIKYTLFFDGFPEKNNLKISYEKLKQGEGVRVVWEMDGIVSYPIFGRYAVFFVKAKMDNLLGEGLINLKKVSEKEK